MLEDHLRQLHKCHVPFIPLLEHQNSLAKAEKHYKSPLASGPTADGLRSENLNAFTASCGAGNAVVAELAALGTCRIRAASLAPSSTGLTDNTEVPYTHDCTMRIDESMLVRTIREEAAGSALLCSWLSAKLVEAQRCCEGSYKGLACAVRCKHGRQA